MVSPNQDDLTPISGSATDVAPVGRGEPKPEHELTADEDRASARWDAIAESADFKELVRSKAQFVVPTTIFFVIYYFLLPLLVGWCPDLMKTKIGSVNLAYLFALSQFFMAWIIAGLYVVKAAGWDKHAAAVLAKFNAR